MKKLLASVIVLLAFTTVTNAQKFTIGAKAGANMTKITGEAFKDGYQLGYQLGGFAELDFSKKWGIGPEVLFNQSNTRPASSFSSVYNSFQDSTSTIKLNYLTIPVLLRYNVCKLLTLNAGPQFGILLDKHQTVLKNGQNAFKNGDLAFVAGASINLSSLRIYGRYNIGLNNINDVGNQDKWKSQQIQLGVGFAL